MDSSKYGPWRLVSRENMAWKEFTAFRYIEKREMQLSFWAECHDHGENCEDCILGECFFSPDVQECFPLTSLEHSHPKDDSRLVVSGVCLFDSRWTTQFPNSSGQFEDIDSMSARSRERFCFNLSISPRREKFLRLIASSKEFRMFLPTSPGEYHRVLVAWIARKIRQFHAKAALIQIPLGDYHSFINEIEKAVGVDLSVVHDYLDSFALRIIQFLRERLGEELWNRICILDDASTVLSMDEMNRLSKRFLYSSEYASSSQSPTLERKVLMIGRRSESESPFLFGNARRLCMYC